MNRTASNPFDIRDFVDRLKPVGREKDRYHCPVCGGNNLTIAPDTGKYNCWNGCDTKDIREAVAPWAAKVASSKQPKQLQKAIRPKADRTWTYTDHSGNPIARSCRIDDGNGKRRIWQEYWDGDCWVRKAPENLNLKARIVPYRYLEVKAAIAAGKPIFWAEGEPCADALWSLGIAATTTIGGSGGYSRGDYAELFKGADLVLCPDCDQSGLKYAETVARDYLNARWLYAFPESSEWQEVPKTGGVDIADWITDGATTETILAAIEAQPRSLEAQAESRTEVPKGWNLADLGKHTKPEEIVRGNFELVTGKPIEDWLCVNNQLHCWAGSHYKPIEDGVVLRQIIEFLRSVYKQKKIGEGEDGSALVKTEYPYGGDRQARAALETVKTAAYLSLDKIPRKGLNLANGTLIVSYADDRPKFELLPHDRSRYYLYVSPVSFNPEADTTIALRLLRAVKGDQLETFLKHQSYFLDFETIIKRNGRPRAGICEGEGSNGKDAIRQAIEALFGQIGNFSFEDFRSYDDGRRFPLATLPNYQYSWASENSHKVKLENLKSLMAAIVGNSPLWSEFKNRDLLQYTPKTCLWFSVNKAPMTDGAASFIKSRFAVYQFDKVFSSVPIGANEMQADPRFAYDEGFRVGEVCPGLLRLLIEAYEQLWAEGIDWQPCEIRLHDWAKQHNHLLEFADDLPLSICSDGVLSISALYESLKDWYRVNEYLEIGSDGRQYWQPPPSNFDALVKRPNDLYKRLKEVFPRIDICTDTDGSITGGKGRKYIRGLAIASSVPATEPVKEPEEAQIEHWEAKFLDAKTDTEIVKIKNQMAAAYPTARHPVKKAVWERLKATQCGRDIRKRIKLNLGHEVGGLRS